MKGLIIVRTYSSESNILPLEWDLESSKTLVYHNYNIEEIEKEFDGTKSTFYTYNVDEYDKIEYLMMTIKQLSILKSDVDYIAATMGVDL